MPNGIHKMQPSEVPSELRRCFDFKDQRTILFGSRRNLAIMRISACCGKREYKKVSYLRDRIRVGRRVPTRCYAKACRFNEGNPELRRPLETKEVPKHFREHFDFESQRPSSVLFNGSRRAVIERTCTCGCKEWVRIDQLRSQERVYMGLCKPCADLKRIKPRASGEYLQIKNPDHPLAKPNGYVRVHRQVYYQKVKGVPGNCHWCGVELHWLTRSKPGTHKLVVDHLDENKRNNKPANLVGSCNKCNRTRGSMLPFLRSLTPRGLKLFEKTVKRDWETNHFTLAT